MRYGADGRYMLKILIIFLSLFPWKQPGQDIFSKQTHRHQTMINISLHQHILIYIFFKNKCHSLFSFIQKYMKCTTSSDTATLLSLKSH